jgi:hypothetical protein
LKISWNNIYKAKAILWKKYGDEFQAEGHAMRKFAQAKAKEDHYSINLSFEKVVCKTQNDDWKANDKKRYGQLKQIRKALKLLSKFGLGGKYGKKVRESIKDINAGLCRTHDDNSQWITVAGPYKFKKRRRARSRSFPNLPKEAYIYKNQDARGHRFVCKSKIRYTFQCTSRCDLRTNDKRMNRELRGSYSYRRYPRLAYFSRGTNNRRKSRTVHLYTPLKWKKSVRSVLLNNKGVATRTKVQIYVVPGCNCLNPNKDYRVTHNQAKTADKQGLIAETEQEPVEEQEPEN